MQKLTALIIGALFSVVTSLYAFAQTNDPIEQFSQRLTEATYAVEWIDLHYGKNASLPEIKKIAYHVVMNSVVQEVDTDVIFGLIATESSYNRLAKSSEGAKGLTQVIPRYHKKKLVGRNLFKIEDSVYAGIAVYRECLENNRHNKKQALKCYVGSKGKKGERYAKTVMAKAADYRHYVKESIIAAVPAHGVDHRFLALLNRS